MQAQGEVPVLECPLRPCRSTTVASLLALAVAFAVAAGRAAAQDAGANPYGDTPIEDNSFLLEEAYNQEPAVIQHIGTFSRATDGSGWLATFTEEWPAPGQEHQLSLTLSGLAVEDAAGRHSGLGDVALNYRYQLARGARVWASPRLSVIAPSGDASRGLGGGGWGAQLALPVSARVARWLVTHSNVGYTFTRRAESADGTQADAGAVSLGQSVIALVTPRLNLMLEGVWTRAEVVTGPDRTRHETSAFVSPGLRLAFDVPGGLQIVPGVAFPIGVGPSSGDRSVFLYLSFEHPFAPLAGAGQDR